MRHNLLIVLAPQKESSVLFQGRSLIEQRNFYILSLIAFPQPVQNISTALFNCDYIVFTSRQALGKPLTSD
jgi:hypothetical protein